MEEKIQQLKPKRDYKIYLAIFLTFLFTSLIVGGAVFFYGAMQNIGMQKYINVLKGKIINLEEEKAELKKQLTNLEQELIKIEDDSLEASVDTNSRVNNYNGRGLTTGTGCFENEGDISFREDFNQEPANIFITYDNTSKGISFDVPYNNNWGNKDCVVKPYLEVEEDSLLYFGKPWAWDGFSNFILKFESQQTADDVGGRVINNCKGFNSVTKEEYITCQPNVKKININELIVVTWDDEGMGTFKHFEVIGKKYNYNFYTLAHLEDELIEVIKTIELID